MKKAFLLFIFYGFGIYGMRKSLERGNYSIKEFKNVNQLEEHNKNVQIPEKNNNYIDDSLPWDLRKSDYVINMNPNTDKTKRDILFALWSGYMGN